ncbi:MAG: DNA primase small subunit domain-containing protein [Candidatus Asgardarchaeia archaeon]
MLNKSVNFLKTKFREYYQKNWNHNFVPEELKRREFGIQLFDNTMIRHLAFSSKQEYERFIKIKAPKGVFYSSAFYDFPEEKNMQKKGWEGAELVFDIDADHIPTKCKEIHDYWICQKCGFRGKGIPPERCPKCGESKIKAKVWFCEKCLEAAKEETFKLIDDFLDPDFGIKKSDLFITFSGHRGYHVHVNTKVVRTLDQNARREIVNYMLGQGIDLRLQGIVETRQGVMLPKESDAGWRGRIVRSLTKLIETPKKYEAYISRGVLTAEEKELLADKKSELLKSIKESSIRKGTLKSQLVVKLIRIAIEIASCKIDTVVTADIKRLMRLPTSLHGKTGFKVSLLTYNELEKFNPLKESIVFKKGAHVIKITDFVPEFILNDTVYGPFKPNEIIEVPDYVAVLLVSKELGEIY